MTRSQITGEQLRAARAMLHFTQRQFADFLQLALSTVRRFERTPGPVALPPAVADGVRGALAQMGIELINAGPYSGNGGPGLRMLGEPVFVSDDSEIEIGGEEDLPGETPAPA